MARGRIKKILLPYLIRHTLFGLVVTSLLFILFLMLRLVTTLTHEINRMSESQHQLSTEEGKAKLLVIAMLPLFTLEGQEYKNICRIATKSIFLF